MRSGDTAAGVLKVIRDTALNVIVRPVTFFQAMPRRGGYRTPYVFLLVVGLFDALLLSALKVLVAGPAAALTFAMHVFLVVPVALTLFSFALTAVLFAFWRLMDSSQSYETAYRTFAYSFAISPIALLMLLVPYLTFVAFFWWFALLVIGSVYVHGVGRLKATAVFAALGLAVVVFLTRAEHYMVRHGVAHPVPQASSTIDKPAAHPAPV
ncbi:MAG: YIP1 family protein [Acidiferrobacter sp.]